jgi:hypothetical protein
MSRMLLLSGVAVAAIVFACNVRGADSELFDADRVGALLRRIETLESRLAELESGSRSSDLTVRPTPMTDWWAPEQTGVGYGFRLTVGKIAVAAVVDRSKSLLDPEIIPVELRGF